MLTILQMIFKYISIIDHKGKESQLMILHISDLAYTVKIKGNIRLLNN